jgi:hypothetical protein
MDTDEGPPDSTRIPAGHEIVPVDSSFAATKTLPSVPTTA